MIRAAYAATDRFLDGTVDDHGPLPPDHRPTEAASRTSPSPELGCGHVRGHLTPSGPPETVLDREPAGRAGGARRRAGGARTSPTGGAIAAAVAASPRSLDGWARLGDHGRDVMERYSAYRVGYHRGLDRLRANGWRGSGYVRWDHELNRGFLRALAGLQRPPPRSARTTRPSGARMFLRQLDPRWPPRADLGLMDHTGFPTEGRPADDLLAEIRAGRGDDADWRGGRTFSLVYNPADPELERLQEAVAHEYLHENYLNPFAFPSLLRMEQEVVGDGRRPLRRHRRRRQAHLRAAPRASSSPCRSRVSTPARCAGIAEPQLLTAATAHPAFAKAAHYLDVEHVLVPVGDDGRLDPGAAAAALTERTALLVGSAPCYPYGVIDPIPELAALAAERDDPVPRRRLPRRVAAPVLGAARRAGPAVGPPRPGRHVAVGRPPQVRLVLQGRVAAAAPRAGPAAPPVLPLRRVARRPVRLGHHRRHPPGAPIAAAWATVSPPRRGRLPAPRRAGARRHPRFRSGIEAIDGLRITGDPVMGVMEISSDVHDLGAVGDVMDDRGWHLDRQQGGLHLMLSPYHLKVADQFLADLAAAVAEHGASRGVEARYGGGPLNSRHPVHRRGAVRRREPAHGPGQGAAPRSTAGDGGAGGGRAPRGRRRGGAGRSAATRRARAARPRRRARRASRRGPLPRHHHGPPQAGQAVVVVLSCDLLGTRARRRWRPSSRRSWRRRPRCWRAVPVVGGHRQWTHAAWRADAPSGPGGRPTGGGRSLEPGRRDLPISRSPAWTRPTWPTRTTRAI